MAEADALREWALSTPVAAAPAASLDQLSRHLEFMHAALPSQQRDADTGRKRVAVYASILAGFPNEALAYMAREACRTLDWFPTPRQCLDLAKLYQPGASEQDEALAACRQFTQDAFDQWLVELRAGCPIGDVPERWLRIATEEGAMRRLADGSYVSRALYHGPARTNPVRASTPRPTPPRAPAAPTAGASAALIA